MQCLSLAITNLVGINPTKLHKINFFPQKYFQNELREGSNEEEEEDEEYEINEETRDLEEDQVTMQYKF